MILELTGSRVLAPYLGTSLITWTSLIGIILGSLSLGYYFGGQISDKKANYQTFSYILLLSAIFISLTALIKEPFLNFLQTSFSDIRISTILATIFLFSPASIMMGMVSPYAVKLKMNNLAECGSTVGKLYAISTVGSIFGTFMAGFLLIPMFGNTKLLIIISISMILASVIAYSGKKKLQILVASMLVLQMGWTVTKEETLAASGIIDIDTQYSRVLIYNSVDRETGKATKLLTMGKTSHSAMFLEDDNLVFEYTKFYKLASHFKPDFKKSLIIGAGAYSFPKFYIQNYPNATLDVVEIDPQLTELAKANFRLKENPNLTIHHEDGRTFLNKNENKYDVIFLDAFGTFYSIPYQLTTLEVVEKIHNSLEEDGVVLMNIIGSIEGKNSEFIQAELKTYKQIFPQVYILPVNYPEDAQIAQNHIIVALKSTEKAQFENTDPQLNLYLKHRWQKEIPLDKPVLTDDHAPVDQYVLSLIK